MDYFQSRSGAPFFESFANAESTIAGLRQRLPNAELGIVQEADRIVGGNFSLLGFRNLQLWQTHRLASRTSRW